MSRRKTELRVGLVDMPELREAFEAGHLRGELHVPLSKRGLGAHKIELSSDEEIIARTALPLEDDDGHPLEGEAILIAKRDALPRMKISADDPRLADLARVLARQA